VAALLMSSWLVSLLESGVLATDPAPTPYLVGTVIGFAIGGFGHIIRSNLVIVSGILVIAATTALFILATHPCVGCQ